MEQKMKKRSKYIFSVLFAAVLVGCSSVLPNTPTPTSIPANTPTPQPPEITFEVTFGEDENCIVTGPSEVSTGEYLFQLNNQSDRKIDIAVTHLIEGHTYQDLLDLQKSYGEPFVKVYWMSQPYYFTRDHIVWHYTLDEPGEHAILLLQHVYVGMWICQPIQVVAD
jgi:hypothetical protein